MWARNVGALLGLLTFVGTAIGWIAKESFQRGFLVVFPWAGVVCLLVAIGFSVYVAVGWLRLGRLLTSWGGTTADGRPLEPGLKGTARFFLTGVFKTDTGLIMTGFTAAAIGGLLVDLWAVRTDRELPPLVVAGVAVSLALLALVGSIQEQYGKLKASRKSCPDCGETVKDIANVCRYCGYRFAPPPPPGDAA